MFDDEHPDDRLQRERIGVAGDPVPDHDYGDSREDLTPDVDPREALNWIVWDHETDREVERFEDRESAETWIEAADGDRRVGADDPSDATGRYEVVDRRPL